MVNRFVGLFCQRVCAKNERWSNRGWRRVGFSMRRMVHMHCGIQRIWAKRRKAEQWVGQIWDESEKKKGVGDGDETRERIGDSDRGAGRG